MIFIIMILNFKIILFIHNCNTVMLNRENILKNNLLYIYIFSNIIIKYLQLYLLKIVYVGRTKIILIPG